MSQARTCLLMGGGVFGNRKAPKPKLHLFVLTF
jgi:hypothetical protein